MNQAGRFNCTGSGRAVLLAGAGDLSLNFPRVVDDGVKIIHVKGNVVANAWFELLQTGDERLERVAGLPERLRGGLDVVVVPAKALVGPLSDPLHAQFPVGFGIRRVDDGGQVEIIGNGKGGAGIVHEQVVVVAARAAGTDDR